MHSRLAIDYGTATVRAVLVSPGAWTVLPLDGGGEMSTAVHVSATTMVTSAAAWRQAAADPPGFVVSPLRISTEQITVAGRQVDVADLVAVTLRQVAQQAQQMAGGPVDEVRLVVPAGWGPRRRTWLRHAARTAGLPVTTVIEAPIAALRRSRLDPAPDTAASGRVDLVIDLGAGCEVSTVQHTSVGSEVLSTLADPDAGGDRIDTALTRMLTGVDLDDLPADGRWPALASVRIARHALSEQVAVRMAMPDGTAPVVVNTGHVADAARPVLQRVAELAAKALENADLSPAQMDRILLIGAVAVTPGAAEMISATFGALPQVAELPHLAAALGAADTGPNMSPADAGTALDGQRRPPWRRLVTLALPAAASMLLYTHFITSAEFNNGTRARPGPHYYVLANWGELTVAAVLAVIGFLQAAALFATLLDQRQSAPGTSGRSRIAGGIGLAAAGGSALVSLYGVTAAVLLTQPIGALLRWSLLPVLPIVVAAVVICTFTSTRPVNPVGGWDSFLTFPATSMITAAVGILGVCLWWHGGLPWWLNDWTTSIGLASGLLVGVAVAFTLVRHPGARIVLVLVLGFFTTILSQSGPGILAVIYAVAVAVWYGWHAWTLIRAPSTAHIT